MMNQVYCYNPVARVGLNRFGSDYQLTETAADAVLALVRSKNLHEEVFGKELLAIARAGAGVNNIPLERAAEEGIVVFNTPGANANGVKELVLAGMLLAARHIPDSISWVKENVARDDLAARTEKAKSAFAGCELAGKTLAVIGLGAIGVQVANAAHYLGMQVIGYDPYVSVKAAWKLSRSVEYSTDLDTVLGKADFITLHVPLTDATRHMIDAAAISKMKEGAVLLNYARDLLVDEAALAEALAGRKVGCYVSDFPNALTKELPYTITTPHIGASTAESEDNCAVMAVRQLIDYMENGNIKNSVNYPDCEMGEVSGQTRLCVLHRNIPNMIARLSGWLGSHDVNIENMVNKSKGGYAYSLFDIADGITEDISENLRQAEGVLRVRVIAAKHG